MKLVADPIILPDDADKEAIELAIRSAAWRIAKSRQEISCMTDYSGKCGSCANFLCEYKATRQGYGKCKMTGRFKRRSEKKCKKRFIELEEKEHEDNT